MDDGLSSLTEREKAVLRLLARGHDAKSAAQALDISVHGVNERLRDARRRLGASSSREAARALAEAEGTQETWDEKIGVDPPAVDGANVAPPDQAGRARRRTVFLLAGAALMLTTVVAALAIVSQGQQPAIPAPAPAAAQAAAAGPIYLLSLDISAPGTPATHPRLTVRPGEMASAVRSGLPGAQFDITLVVTPEPARPNHVRIAINMIAPDTRQLRRQQSAVVPIGEPARFELPDDHGRTILTVQVRPDLVRGM